MNMSSSTRHESCGHRSAFTPDLDVTFRPMFGGLFAYADNKPFASLSDVGSALKIADNERDAMLALPDVNHFALNQLSWPENHVSS